MASVARPDYRSEEAKAYRKWYWTQRWRRLRAVQLRDHPLCAICQKQGKVEAATVCDHVEPHRGNEVKFWTGPFQSLCKPCHSGGKQAEEKSGKVRTIVGLDGWPVV